MFRKKIEPADRIAVVTVHGTGDSGPPAGDKWWQVGSPFAEGLKAHLASRDVKAEIVPHIWSGANSASDREAGADALAALIRDCAQKFRGVHVIGHSHGGNVANDAADFLGWGRRQRKKKRDPISSVTTVGTPYFNSKTGLPQKGAGIAFMAVTWGSLILFPLVTLAWLITILYTWLYAHEVVGERVTKGEVQPTETASIAQLIQAEQSNQSVQAVLLVIYAVLVGLALRFMWRMSTRGVRRVLRPKRMKNSPTQIFSIWHPNDEAIAFLRKVDQAPIEPFPKGSLYRGSRTSAVGFSVLVVVVLALVSLAGVLTPLAVEAGLITREALARFMDVSVDEVTAGGASGFFLALTFIAVFMAPVIFSFVFFAYRYIVGALLEWRARGWLNNGVANTLRGMAFGKDGDQKLCQISTTSHTINSRSLILEGDVASRMRDRAEVAMDKLLKQYRWALFDVDDNSVTSFDRLAKDALTWDSLIHTTYFDQGEVLAAIGDHIAAEAKRLGEA